MTLSDIFKDQSFMSFDISVRSTGWCKYKNGVLTYGSFELKHKSELQRRMDFRNTVISLIDETYDFIAIEDVIAGCNFETTKTLVQLNSIIDDLVYLGELPCNNICRIGNTIWKKYLKEVSSYRGIKAAYGKEEIKESIQSLGFKEDVVQDIYDSIGIAVGVVVQKQDSVKCTKAKLRTDLSKSYNFYSFSDDKLKSIIESTGLSEFDVDFDFSYRDMLSQFKQEVMDSGDNFIFVLNAPRDKYGVLALTGKLPMHNSDNRIIAIKKSIKIKTE